jgi:Icc-related predicted phosphoesterase
VKLLVFSDIHGDYPALARLMKTEADYYIAAGDLANWGRGLDRCGEILRERAGRVYVVPGNHESDRQIADLCEKHGLSYFHGQSFEAGGYHFAGLGYSTPTPFDTPGEYSEDELAERLVPFAGLEPLILICHSPPYGTTLDRIRPGLNAGSRSVGEFVNRYQPEYFFCGHIHEAAGVREQIGRTFAMNVGKRGYLLELNKV